LESFPASDSVALSVEFEVGLEVDDTVDSEVESTVGLVVPSRDSGTEVTEGLGVVAKSLALEEGVVSSALGLPVISSLSVVSPGVGEYVSSASAKTEGLGVGGYVGSASGTVGE
jgi:hypothetical protein